MKLSQDVIYYYLNKKHLIRFEKGAEAGLKLMRPVFFENGAQISGCTVIIGAKDLKRLADKSTRFDDTLFICTDILEKGSKTPEASIIAIESKASPVSIFNYLQEVYNLFDGWDEALKDILEHGTFSDIIDSCDPFLCDPVSLIDEIFRYIGYSKALSRERGLVESAVSENNSLPTEQINHIITSRDFTKAREIDGIYMAFTEETDFKDLLCRNIFSNGRYVGQLIMRLGSSEAYKIRYDKAILERIYYYVDKLYAKNSSFNQNTFYLGGMRNLIIDRLEGKIISEEQWDEVFRENGWRLTDNLQLVQFRPNPLYEKNYYAKYYCTEIERVWQGCACIDFKGDMLFLINLNHFSTASAITFYQALAYFLRDNLLVAGLSRIMTDMAHIKSAYEQAQTALDYGLRLNPALWYHKFDDYALNYMLSSCLGPYETEDICSEKLLILKKYDAEKNTEYFKTLEAYFECGFNAAATAKKLFIQRSSFLKRIGRIEKLTGIDFNSYEEMLYNAISFKLLQKSY